MNESVLETRILTLLDGELSPGEAAELETILLGDEEARETYRDLVHLHNALESRFAAEPTVRQMTVVPMDRLIATQQGQLLHRTLLATAAILMISVVTIWLVPAQKPSRVLGSIKATPDALLSLSYEGMGKAPQGNKLVAGSRLRLTQGMMEGVFENGVRLVAESPCEIRVLDKGKLSLESGNAWFQVPPAAIGFKVNTPELKVVDLGTEFGVVSSPAGSDELHVIKGKVEVTSNRGSRGKQTLVAGAALQVGKDGELHTIEPDASLFETELPETREIAIVNHSFENDVIPRDGNRVTKDTGSDDYDKAMVPSGWEAFNDGRADKEKDRGLVSTAPDSNFSASLAVSPDADANDQVFFSNGPDIFQVLTEPLQANRSYVLSVDVADRKASGIHGRPGAPGIHLGVGTTPGEGWLKPVSSDFPRQVEGGWVRWTVTYRTGPAPEGLGKPLRIELTSGGQVSWFDAVRLTLVHN